MTKEAYFEMCEMLGSEPIDSETPVEFDDFPIEVQQAFGVYRMLRDEWDTMTGSYLGKSLIGIRDLLDTSEIELQDQKFIVMLVRLIDQIRSDEINNKLKAEKPAS
jgi:hypothetical protein